MSDNSPVSPSTSCCFMRFSICLTTPLVVQVPLCTSCCCGYFCYVCLTQATEHISLYHYSESMNNYFPSLSLKKFFLTQAGLVHFFSIGTLFFFQLLLCSYPCMVAFKRRGLRELLAPLDFWKVNRDMFDASLNFWKISFPPSLTSHILCMHLFLAEKCLGSQQHLG